MANKLVRIHWRDAAFSPGWHFKQEIPTSLSSVESVGWLIDENDEFITIALSLCDDGVAGHVSLIPKVNIVERYEFKDEENEHCKT